MAYEYDELDTRRRDRQLQQQQLRQARRAARMRRWLAACAVLTVALLVGMVLLFRGKGDAGSMQTQPPQTSLPPVTTQPLPTAPQEPETVIHLSFGGDVHVTDEVAALEDYTSVFMDVAGLFSQSHAAVVNFEGNLVGPPYGSTHYSAPQALVNAMAAAGIDMVQSANSVSIDNGLGGLSQTLAGLKDAGLEPLGAFSSNEEFAETQGFTLKTIGGIRVAFVAFTKGLGGLGLPDSGKNRVNLLYTDYATSYQKIDTLGITSILQAIAEQKPDITIALLHWGSEFNDTISTSQEKIVNLMHKNGVDAIIGTHPHYVQKVTYSEENGRLVAYSLGDLLGSATEDRTQYSIILDLEITRNNETGETRITGWDYEPIYLLTPQRDGEPMRILRLREAIAMYENNHVSRVSTQAYNNMVRALSRIEARLGSQ